MKTLEKEMTLYNGFIIPKDDARDLRLNEFTYNTDEGCFKGIMEDVEGALHSFEYYPANHFWNEVYEEENY